MTFMTFATIAAIMFVGISIIAIMQDNAARR